MGSLLIRNALRVATFNDAGEEWEHADVAVRGNRIEAVGRGLAPPEPDARVLDASGMVCLPGFVNCHHHLFQTLTRAVPRVQDAELFEWLTNLYKLWRHVTPEAAHAAALVGLGELLLTGCTTSTDHFYLHPKAHPQGLIDAEIEAARTLGIRFHPTRGCMSRGESRGGLPPDDIVQDEEAILADCERLIAKYHDPAPDAMLKIALAPCAPFSVDESTMTAFAQMARQHGLRLHTHMAETRDEEVYCAEHYGMRPIAWAEKVGWLGPDVWFAHVVHVTPEEIRMLAESGTGVAHCPASNMRLGSGIAPVTEMLAAGVRVGLGVDGSSSNDTGDMWGEARLAMLLQRVARGAAAVGAREILRCATRGGATILGYDQLGMIAPGALADLILIDTNRIGFAGAQHDPVAALLFAGDSHIVDYTIVNGEVVVERGRLTRAAEEAIVEAGNAAGRGLVEAAAKFRQNR
ncbi:MAG: 8-oxoguanine deaminase [Candidatus Sumerlaeaceae bacterium]|nr:8-oxoguanine deaminase [Candidatus Sumerlaeaceae bacterium]